MKRYLTIILLAGQSLLLAQSNYYQVLADSSQTLIHSNVSYDPSYFSIPFPNGDVPPNVGVCTDVIVRAYRKIGVDLQYEVHQDMKDNFDIYPNYWGLRATDKNIDHRRVPNLMKFFERKGTTLPISTNPKDYQPGDIVCWDLGNGIKHIGVLINERSTDGKRPHVVHNIGGGQVSQDMLFDYKIIGHYRYGNH